MRTLIFLFFVCFFSACRTVAPPEPIVVETQTIPVFSQPSGAQVVVDGVDKGETPVSVVMEKNKNHMVMICKEGFKPQAIQVNRQINKEDLAYKGAMRFVNYSLNTEEKNPFTDLQKCEETGRIFQLQPAVVNVALERE